MAEFLEMRADIGIQSVKKLQPRCSNLNAYAERLARTIKESCLDRLILFGEGSPRKAIREFVAITIGNEIIKGWATGSLPDVAVKPRP